MRQRSRQLDLRSNVVAVELQRALEEENRTLERLIAVGLSVQKPLRQCFVRGDDLRLFPFVRRRDSALKPRAELHDDAILKLEDPVDPAVHLERAQYAPGLHVHDAGRDSYLLAQPLESSREHPSCAVHVSESHRIFRVELTRLDSQTAKTLAQPLAPPNFESFDFLKGRGDRFGETGSQPLVLGMSGDVRKARDCNGQGSRRFRHSRRDGSHSVQLVANLAQTPGARRRFLREHASEEALDLRHTRVGDALRKSRRIAVEDRVGDLNEIVPLEGPASCDQLVEDHSQREDVGACVQRLSSRLLRRHVVRRPGDLPVELERSVSAQREGVRDPSRLNLRESEVQDLHSSVRDHEVRRLDVPVHNAARVGFAERVRGLIHEIENIVERKRSAHHQFREGLARHVFHRQEVHGALRRGGLLDVVDDRDVRVAQCRCGPRFTKETRAFLLLRPLPLAQELQRDRTMQAEVFGEEYLSHPALPQALEDAVVGDRGPDHGALGVPGETERHSIARPRPLCYGVGASGRGSKRRNSR